MFDSLIKKFIGHPVVSSAILGAGGLFLVALGLLAGYQLGLQRQTLSGFESRSGGYDFINPLLECEVAQDLHFAMLRPAQDHVSEIVNKYVKLDTIHTASVYFRDLNNGPWFGINEHALFAPASLFKVPLAVAVLKKAESDPELLQKPIVFEKQQAEKVVSPNFIPSKELEVGSTYTIEELLERMLIFSDNEAMVLLTNQVDENFLIHIERDLGLQLQNGTDGQSSLSVRTYSSIFRILYNASYLNREMSDKLLRILAKSEFKSGLAVGVPPGIVISHKFGERGSEDLNKVFTTQLHDCGIVYSYQSPYLLCVMTKGSDFDTQLELIQAVSKAVFEDISKK